MNEAHTAIVLHFVNHSFRDMADRDYVAARCLFRHGLDHQFLWMAQQAVEKYLKAILLYNGVSSRGLSHNLTRALRRLNSISDIPFEIPKDVREFITFLKAEGLNRYFESPSALNGDELLKLDRTVWYLRRYCYWMRSTPHDMTSRLPREIAHVHSFPPAQVHEFRISGGYLERLLDDPRTLEQDDLVAQQKVLIWKNFYYGHNKKRMIKKFTVRRRYATSIHYLEPTIFPYLDQLVDFSKGVRNVFRKRTKGTRLKTAFMIAAERRRHRP